MAAEDRSGGTAGDWTFTFMWRPPATAAEDRNQFQAKDDKHPFGSGGRRLQAAEDRNRASVDL
jgi:hypothetical protein